MEHAPDTGRAGGDHVGIEHHESQRPIALQRMVVGEGDDLAFLLFGKPVVAWHPGIVLVDFAIAFSPVVELAGAQRDPVEETAGRDLGLVAPGADEVDELIANVVGNPASL